MSHLEQSPVLLKKTHLIFDLDGTLVDSVPDLATAVNRMLDSLGLAPFPVTVIRGWVGNGAKILVERALSGQRAISHELNDDYAKEALAIFMEHYRQQACVDTMLYQGVNDTLTQLQQRGYQMHIVTNKPLEFVQPIIDSLGISHYFSMILGADSLPKKKPDPLPLSHICQTKQIDIEECVMVGDSHNDILAANAIGMESIALTYGYNYGEDIRLHEPTVVCEYFHDLLASLPMIKSVVN